MLFYILQKYINKSFIYFEGLLSHNISVPILSGTLVAATSKVRVSAMLLSPIVGN